MNRRTWIILGVLAFVLARAAKAAVVNFAPNVDMALRPEMARALPFIQEAHDDVGITRGAYITSGKDGAHGADSLHALGLAVDMRTKDLPPSTIAALVVALRSRLNGSGTIDRPYQVVVEPNPSAPNADMHIHVEYQPYPGYRG